MHEILHVTSDKWKKNIDINLLSVFVADNHDDAINNLYRYFSNALNLKGEASKSAASIGSCNVPEDPCGLFDGPIFTTLDEIEEALGSVLNDSTQVWSVKSVIASVEANRLKCVSADYLSKLWYIPEPLAEGLIDKNNERCRHSAENILSRQFYNNDQMIRYRRIQITFYTETMFALKSKSTRGNNSCQVFVSDKGFIGVYPM